MGCSGLPVVSDILWRVKLGFPDCPPKPGLDPFLCLEQKKKVKQERASLVAEMVKNLPAMQET